MTVNTAGLERAVREHALARAEKLADEFVKVAQQMVPRRTQELHDSIEVDSVDEGPNGYTAHVVVGADYGKYVDEGTGIYGPEGAMIKAKPGKFLVFDWIAAGGIVFAKKVKGSEPTHFWQRALDAWPSIVRDG